MPNADPALLQTPARLRMLRRLKLLDSPSEAAFDRLTTLASKLIHAPVTLVSLIDTDRQFFKSAVGLGEPWASARETPLSHSFCQHVVATNEPLIISDSREHPLVFDNLAIPDLNVIAYVGMPLTMHDGSTLGSFCAIDNQPRVWTAEEIDIVRTLAESVVVELELRSELATRQEAETAVRAQNTTLTKTNRELAAAQAQAETANQFRKQFLGTMSHELRNPLNVVIGYSELMLATDREVMTDKQVEYQELILTNARYVLQLVNEVLDLSKLEVGPDALTIGAMEMSPFLAEIEAEGQAAAATKGLVFSLTVDHDLPPVLAGDEAHLRQVLNHLLANAVKFTDSGGVSVTVGRHGTHRWHFTVTDTGVGIPIYLQEVIFSEFRQTQEGSRRGGAGLGLAIARKLVLMMGGTLLLHSKVDAGSSFIVTLPLVVPNGSM